MAPLSRALIFLYPFLLHFCIATDRPTFALWYLAGILILPLLTELVSRRQFSGVGLACAVLATMLLTVFSSQEMLVFKILPLSIYVALFLLFANSLRDGSMPVISRIAELLDADISTAALNYTRKVTAAWAGFFFTMTIISTLLAIYASDVAWSSFVNIVSYGLTGLFFLIEFLVRKRVLGTDVDYSFLEFLQRLSSVKLWQLWSQGSK
jgi:uncharacterized membrane protein